MAVRREVLSDEYVDRAVAAITPETADFQDYITRTAWGDVWTREQLDRRSRSLVTLGVLIALSHEHELGLHLRAALRNGLTRVEIAEVILHASVYAGVPAANRAAAVMRGVFAET